MPASCSALHHGAELVEPRRRRRPPRSRGAARRSSASCSPSSCPPAGSNWCTGISSTTVTPELLQVRNLVDDPGKGAAPVRRDTPELARCGEAVHVHLVDDQCRACAAGARRRAQSNAARPRQYAERRAAGVGDRARSRPRRLNSREERTRRARTDRARTSRASKRSPLRGIERAVDAVGVVRGRTGTSAASTRAVPDAAGLVPNGSSGTRRDGTARFAGSNSSSVTAGRMLRADAKFKACSAAIQVRTQRAG